MIRLVSMRAIEANDEWLVGRSYISRQSMATLYETRTEKTLSPQDRRGGGDRAHRGLSRQPFTDEASAKLLHHVPGLDSREHGLAHGKGVLSARQPL